MWLWIGISVGVLILIWASWWIVHRWRRRRIGVKLARQREEICRQYSGWVKILSDKNLSVDDFQQDHLLRVDHFLDEECLHTLREEGLSHLDQGIRSYIPTHKKGRSLPYESLHHFAPHCLALYHSDTLRQWVGKVVGEEVYPAGVHDQSAASILFYDQPGDHINWHFDHNFYHGRQFTVLISLVNKGPNGSLSASKLMRKDAEGNAIEVDSSENTLVVFEGAQVLHRVSPTDPGDLRVIFSMTYNTVPKIGPMHEFCRRVKDTAFHGLKALWD